MSEQEVVVSEGWWLTRSGHAYLVVRADSPESFHGVSQPWKNAFVFDCYWSDDGRFMPPYDNIFDLMEKLDPSDPRVISYEPEYGRPATVPAQAEPAIMRAIRPDCTWTPGDPDDDYAQGHYYTGCRNDYEAGQGTPTENGMAFCCYCGGKLIEGEVK